MTVDVSIRGPLGPAQESELGRLAREQGLVVQKRRGSAAAGGRVYRLAHWVNRAPLVHDTPPPPGKDPLSVRAADQGWVSLNHLLVVLSAPDLTARIDLWWHHLAPDEQRCVLDNAEQLPDRFLADLSAAGIGVSGVRLPDCVRRHLHRVAIPTAAQHEPHSPGRAFPAPQPGTPRPHDPTATMRRRANVNAVLGRRNVAASGRHQRRRPRRVEVCP